MFTVYIKEEATAKINKIIDILINVSDKIFDFKLIKVK